MALLPSMHLSPIGRLACLPALLSQYTRQMSVGAAMSLHRNEPFNPQFKARLPFRMELGLSNPSLQIDLATPTKSAMPTFLQCMGPFSFPRQFASSALCLSAITPPEIFSKHSASNQHPFLHLYNFPRALDTMAFAAQEQAVSPQPSEATEVSERAQPPKPSGASQVPEEAPNPSKMAKLALDACEGYTGEPTGTLGPTIASQKPRLVILGTGWGACRLAKDVNTKYWDLVVISPRNHMVSRNQFFNQTLYGIPNHTLHLHNVFCGG
jgi:hypothetical protein